VFFGRTEAHFGCDKDSMRKWRAAPMKPYPDISTASGDHYPRSTFQPARGGRIIQSAVIDPDTATTISELFADPDSLVEVVFDVVSTFMPGDETRPKRSRSVKSIRGWPGVDN
jgi:hypothetical protein